MKKILVIFCLIVLQYNLWAQKQANTWYFGNSVGLDFNQNPPVPINGSGLANSYEGISTISDNNGKLLFYSNGITVINKAHQQMQNGFGLQGNKSSTNNTLIVPVPGADGIYHLYTTGAALQEPHVFSYSIIDIKANSGAGSVTSKNVLIEDTVFEKIAGIRHCNKKDVWVIVHKWNTDEYHAYLVTSLGLNPTPVVSHTGLVITGYENNELGTIKPNSKGNKIAIVHSFDYDSVELLDFDNTTGVMSNPIVIKPNVQPHVPFFIGVYGAEFSPDGRLLYVSANNSFAEPSVLYQFDITSNNSATITASRQIIAKEKPWDAGALQLAPDGKIYMAMWRDTSLSVIDNPNVYGAGCNFRYNKIKMGTLGQEPVQYGLPTFIQSDFDPDSNPYDFSRTSNCQDKNVAFKLSRLNGIDSVKWQFGDGQQSSLLQPVHGYSTTGFFNVTLIVYKMDCSGINDSVSRRIWVADKTDFLGKDTSNCGAISLRIGAQNIEAANYLWNTGYIGDSITTASFGTYWLEIEQNGCKIRDSIIISLKSKPAVSLGPDTLLCRYKPIELKTGYPFADTYLWSTGETTPSIVIDRTGEYNVTVTKDGCVASDTVKVGLGDCDVYIPSAFTPNGDGVNEKFGVLTEVGVKSFSLQIFNKWGQLVYKSDDISQKWDGTYKGVKVPSGAYVWMINYINLKNEMKYLQGMVMVLY